MGMFKSQIESPLVDLPPPPHGSIVRGQGGRQSPSRCAGPSLRAIQIDGRPVRVKSFRHEVGAGKTVLRNRSIFVVIKCAGPLAVALRNRGTLAAIGI